jgi:hypothetical protein
MKKKIFRTFAIIFAAGTVFAAGIVCWPLFG